MSKLKKADFYIIVILLLLITGIVLFTVDRINSGSNTVSVSTGSPEKEVKYTDYNGKKVGIVTGSNFEEPSFRLFPDSEYFYYNNITDLLEALQEEKIDCCLCDEPIIRMVNSENPKLSYIDKKVNYDDYAFGFTKNNERSDRIRKQFNEFLKEIRNNGTYKELYDIWLGEDESKKFVDLSGFSGERLNVVLSATEPPFNYFKDNKLVGFTVNMLEKFCREYGYEPYFEDVDFSARVPGLVSNKYDICIGIFTVTEERAESINYSDPIYRGGVCLAVRAEDLNEYEGSKVYRDYDGKNFGILVGSAFEQVTFDYFPNSNYLYFDTVSDMTLALQQDKIDAFINDQPIARSIAFEQPDIDYVQKPLIEDTYSFGFPKSGEKTPLLVASFNAFLQKMNALDELNAIYAKWIEGDKADHTLDEEGFTGENGTLSVAVVPDMPPFSYYEDNKLVGICIDLTLRFGKEYGYNIKFIPTSGQGFLAGIASKIYDIGASNLSPTEERKEYMTFSDSYYTGGFNLIARKNDLDAYNFSSSNANAEKESIFTRIAASFEKNFIREERWKLIVQGIGTTCLITILTVFFGSILAFLICMFRRIDSIIANKICNIYVKLMQGTPILVLLMILYYVVFGKSGIDAIWVAVLGFSLNLGAFGSEIMRSGIDGIDVGQKEAALALGFTENQAFFRFIFPQAALRFIPVYRGEIISLLKNTSIVGYIAIQDLTKMSDIIRSRTFEAFFPLIATAIIYFIFAWIITICLSKLLKAIDPKRKKKGVKGVQTK